MWVLEEGDGVSGMMFEEEVGIGVKKVVVVVWGKKFGG